MRQDETANRESFQEVSSLPAAHKALEWKREFTGAEYDRIARGLIPRGMDDRWFIFLEDEQLYIHRSWTGFLIYQVRFERDGEKYVVAQVLVNRDPTQYRATDDEYDVRFLSFLIDTLLLGKPAAYPSRPQGAVSSES